MQDKLAAKVKASAGQAPGSAHVKLGAHGAGGQCTPGWQCRIAWRYRSGLGAGQACCGLAVRACGGVCSSRSSGVVVVTPAAAAAAAAVVATAAVVAESSCRSSSSSSSSGKRAVFGFQLLFSRYFSTAPLWQAAAGVCLLVVGYFTRGFKC